MEPHADQVTAAKPQEPRPLLTGNVPPEHNPKLRGENVVAMDADDPVWNAPALVSRLRDVDEQNALIVRRRAADRLERLEALLEAADGLPLWRLEDADIPDEEFEAVTRFRAALYLLNEADHG